MNALISEPVLNTLVFLLAKAFNELFAPRQIVIEHSFSDGLFCHEASWEEITEEEISQLEKLLNDWVSDPTLVELEKPSKGSIMEKLILMDSKSKIELLNQWGVDPVPVIRFGQHWDLQIGSAETNKSLLNVFSLIKYNDGFLFRVFNSEKGKTPFKDQPKLFSIIEEHEQWGSILGVSTIREINEFIRAGDIMEMILVAEGLHEKKISIIADQLADNFPMKKIITIAGPSSSGKTTFAKRLGIQLRVNGFNTIQISMDDYFVDRKFIPRNEKGEQDFENIDVVDIPLLSERIQKLLNGEEIPVRKFDFVTGVGKDTDKTVRLGPWDFILFEGIHGLNPKLTSSLGKDHLQKIYISAITQMNMDANHRISTSDNRLLRRIVRDHKFRGYPVEKTIKRWASVRQGEEKHIFPFQEEADIMFNSSLIYEIPVLGKYAKPLLRDLKSTGVEQQRIDQLNLLLTFFESIDENIVPGISILREFIGDSDFNY